VYIGEALLAKLPALFEVAIDNLTGVPDLLGELHALLEALVQRGNTGLELLLALEKLVVLRLPLEVW
jgi:hypothetical protein